MLTHYNMDNHALKWLEDRLAVSFEMDIIDAEMLQMMTEFMKLVAVIR